MSQDLIPRLKVQFLLIKDENVLSALARSRRNALSPSQYNVQIPLKENFTSFSEDGIPVVGREMMRKK